MSRIKRNIVANFAGSAWTALMSLVFLPFYVHFMGIEAYGLVGVFVTLQAIFALLDMGLTTTLNRELARLAIHKNSADKMRDMVRTLEKFYWIIAIIVAVIVFSLASTIAQKWLNTNQLSSKCVEQSIMLMGCVIAFQLTANFYAGGLLGLQRQVLNNSILISMATLRGIGAVLVLWLISPSIQTFFFWQLAVSVLQTLLSAILLGHSLPKAPGKATFQFRLVQNTWRFAIGVGGITALASILTQLDKIILSRLISLEMFGYYTLAGAVAMGLYRVIGPIFTALYPRFTQLASAGDTKELINLYHTGCQLISIIVFPIAITVALFSHDILFIWTQNTVTADQTSMILSLLIIGTACNGCMHLPYALQLAHGWTKLGFYTNLIAVLILAPMIYLMALYYGAIGAAIVWIALNCGYISINLQIMHRRLLPTEKWRWYIEDSGKPLLAAILTAGIGKMLWSNVSSPVLMLLTLICISLATLIASTLTASQIRIRLARKILNTNYLAREN